MLNLSQPETFIYLVRQDVIQWCSLVLTTSSDARAPLAPWSLPLLLHVFAHCGISALSLSFPFPLFMYILRTISQGFRRVASRCYRYLGADGPCLYLVGAENYMTPPPCLWCARHCKLHRVLRTSRLNHPFSDRPCRCHTKRMAAGAAADF